MSDERRIVWHATINAKYGTSPPATHRFTGDYEREDWVTPADALRGIAMAVWNFLDAVEDPTDEFEIGIGLAYTRTPEPVSPEAVTPHKEREP